MAHCVRQEFLSDLESYTMDYLVEHNEPFTVRGDLFKILDLEKGEHYAPRLILTPNDPKIFDTISIPVGSREETNWESIKKTMVEDIADWHKLHSKQQHDEANEQHA